MLSRFTCVPLFVTPWTATHWLLHPWDSLGKSTGVGCHATLQVISYTPTQSKKFFFKKGRISSSQGRWLLKSTWVLYLASKCWHAIGFHCLLILWLHPLRLSCLYYDNAVHVSVPRTLLSDLSSTHLPAILMLAKHILALATFLIKTLQCLLVPCRLKQILFNFGKMDPLSMML